jgi:hypothetical protein
MASPSPVARRASAGAGRIGAAWRALPGEQRLAASGALALFVTMFLPWYQRNGVDRSGHIISADASPFEVFSFIEAAILLVALALLVLLFARAEGRAFHLPGGDGTTVLVAGAWTLALLVWRLFDKPGLDRGRDAVGNVGVQWGIFFALGAAGLIAYAGTRMRAAHRPEPPNPTATIPLERPTDVVPPRPPRGRRAETEDQLTIPLEGEPAEPAPAPAPEPAPPFDDLTRPHGSEPPLPREDLTLDLGDESPRRRPPG